jgi:hypothetical protein
MLERIKKLNLFEKIQAIVKRPIILIAAGIFMLFVLTAAGYGIWSTRQPPAQPIQFNHKLHLGFGLQCLYCHPGAWRQASAGLPSQTKCWGCHQQIPIKTGDQQKLADFVKSGDPIPWVPVCIQPDFVYFNHRPHIAAGVNCETCHAEISYMTVAQPQKKQNMGWCLHCHRTRAADDLEKLTRLTDCSTCHR